MVYFLIVGLFILPFVLNTSHGLLSKKNKWLHPLFFTFSVMAILQIGLSWISLFEIRDYFLFEAMTIAILLVIVVVLISYFLFLIFTNKNKISFSNILKFNTSSLVIGAILLVQLISLILLPELSNFSDTSAYMSISSNFKINGNYFFNHSDPLPIFYRLPSGYFINSVIAVNNDFKTPYKILWPLLTINMFYWTIHFYIFEKYQAWKEKYKHLFTAFATICYLALSYVSLFTFASGNLEAQSLLVLIALVLFLTKQGAHSLILVFAFSLFSTTALLISPPIIIVAICYLIIKGKRYEVLYALSEAFSLLLLALSIIFYGKNMAVASVAIGLSTIVLPIALLIIKSFKSTHHLLHASLLHSFGLSFYKTKYKFDALFKQFHKNKNVKNILILVLFFVAFISTAITTYQLTFMLSTINRSLIYIGAALTGIIGIYSIYALIRKSRVPELVSWIIFFNLAYLLTCVLLIPTNLFSSNASAWRIALGSVSIGFYCTYVGLLAILILTMYDDHINFWANLFKSPNIKKMRLTYMANYVMSSFIILGLVSASTGTWVIRMNTINKITGKHSNENTTWNLTDKDYQILKTINYYNDEKTIVKNNVQPDESFLFSYYSDVELTAYLNNCFAYTYSEPWSANFMNDFVSTDAWVHVIQGRPINQLLYFDVANTIKNVNYIIEQILTTQTPLLNNSKQSITYNNSMGIFVSDEIGVPQLDQPIKSDRIQVKGMPDLIILNNQSNYYNSLTIVEQTSISADQTYKIGNRGYKLLKQTDKTSYFGTIDQNWDKLLSLNLN